MIIIKGLYNKVDIWALGIILIQRLKEINEKLLPESNICIHCGVEGTHSPSGYHPKGMAVDMHFERNGELLQPAAMVKFLLSNWKGGLGVYTHWNNPGFHLDVGTVRTWWKKDNSELNYTLGEYLNEFGLNRELT